MIAKTAYKRSPRSFQNIDVPCLLCWGVVGVCLRLRSGYTKTPPLYPSAPSDDAKLPFYLDIRFLFYLLLSSLMDLVWSGWVSIWVRMCALLWLRLWASIWLGMCQSRAPIGPDAIPFFFDLVVFFVLTSSLFKNRPKHQGHPTTKSPTLCYRSQYNHTITNTRGCTHILTGKTDGWLHDPSKTSQTKAVFQICSSNLFQNEMISKWLLKT